MGRVDVRQAETGSERVSGETGVPVVAVDERVLELPLADERFRVGGPLGHDVAHPLLADEVGAAGRDAHDAQAVAEDLDLRLVLELAGEDVHGVPEAGEALGQAQDVDDLTAGVSAAQLGLAGDIAVRGDHHDPAGWGARHGTPVPGDPAGGNRSGDHRLGSTEGHRRDHGLRRTSSRGIDLRRE